MFGGSKGVGVTIESYGILKMTDILKILKTQNCSSNGDLSLVKFYVSIIIQLEVININVRNFKFPKDVCHFQNGCQNTA
jgi:hypothetical protein